jgi:hypothetical protein
VDPFLPQKIKNLQLHYTLVDPLHIRGVAKGAFGDLDCTLTLPRMELEINLRGSPVMLKRYKHTLKEFTKDQNGEYHYAKTLKF